MGTSSGRAQFNRRVLVIDDQPSIHEDFRKILVGDAEPLDLDAMEAAVFGIRAAEPRRIRFEVDSAYQGAEAIEKIRQARAEKRPYALTFVDVRMPPGFDGVETLAMIFEDDQDIQAVLCTAYSDWSWSAMAERIDNEGRFLILKKPFDAAEVRQMAAAMTMKWSEQAALHAAYRRQELLHAVTRLLVRAPSPAICAPAVVELIGKTLDFPFVALWCCADTARFECLGAFAEDAQEALGQMRASSLSLEDSARLLPKEGFEAATFYTSPSVESDERAVLATNAGLRGVLLLPVRVADRNLGVLEMWRSSTAPPDRGEIALLEELCSRLAHCLDRALMLESLAQREASLRALFLALADIIYYLGRDGKALVPPFLQGGVLPNLSPGASLLDAVPEDRHTQLLEMLARVMDTGAVEQFNFSAVSGGRQFDARIAPMLETAAVVVLRDVTGI
jgi:CheY-like chemotaxis protein